jgi:AAA+ superfamily predicted ATPase
LRVAGVCPWLNEIRLLHAEGHNAFILWGNIKDVYPEHKEGGGTVYRILDYFITRRKFLTGEEGAYRAVLRYGIGTGISISCGDAVAREEIEAKLFHPAGEDARDGHGRGTDDAQSDIEEIRRLERKFARSREEERRRIESSTRESLMALFRFLKSEGNICLVVDQLEKIAPRLEAAVDINDRMNLQILAGMCSDYDIRVVNDNKIIMLTEDISRVSRDIISSGPYVSAVHIGWPQEEHRREFIGFLMDDEGIRRWVRFADGIEPSILARPTSGFSLMEIFKLFRMSRARGVTLDHDVVRGRKKKIISGISENLLEEYEARYGLERVGGLKNVKDAFRNLAECFKDPEMKRLIPTAILEVGERGVGKTHIVRALAKEVGINCLRLKNIRSMWVGESERHIEKVFELVESYCPLVLILDEIDGMFERRGMSVETNSVEHRLLTAMLEFMSSVEEEHRGDILIVGISNRPDLLDDALVDRFRNLIIPFFVPSVEESMEILRAIAADEDEIGLAEGFDFEAVEEAVEGLTPRHLYFVYMDAAALARKKGKKEVGNEEFAEARAEYIAHHNRYISRQQTLLAVKFCTHRRFIPKREIYGYDLVELSENPEALEAELRELGRAEHRTA